MAPLLQHLRSGMNSFELASHLGDTLLLKWQQVKPNRFQITLQSTSIILLVAAKAHFQLHSSLELLQESEIDINAGKQEWMQHQQTLFQLHAQLTELVAKRTKWESLQAAQQEPFTIWKYQAMMLQIQEKLLGILKSVRKVNTILP